MSIVLSDDLCSFTPDAAKRAQGGLLNLSQISYEIEHPHPTWAEENPEIWWQAFQQGLEGAFLRSSVRKSEIAGIGISNMCPSLVALDKEGNPLRPAILYLDRRSVVQTEQVIERYGLDEIFRRVGNRVAAGTFSVTSMLWLKEHEPEVYRKTHVFGHANTFLAAPPSPGFSTRVVVATGISIWSTNWGSVATSFRRFYPLQRSLERSPRRLPA